MAATRMAIVIVSRLNSAVEGPSGGLVTKTAGGAAGTIWGLGTVSFINLGLRPAVSSSGGNPDEP